MIKPMLANANISMRNEFTMLDGSAGRTRTCRTSPSTGCSTNRTVGFFPGLGSRGSYRDLGRSLLDSNLADVRTMYREGAHALFRPGPPERLLITSENTPSGRIAQQGFIGAAMVIHNLAIAAHFRAAAEAHDVHLHMLAHTGESLGIVPAAVASGALQVADGVRIAEAFAPLMLLAANQGPAQGSFECWIASYLTTRDQECKLVTEPYHVIGLVGAPDDLDEALHGIAMSYARNDIEVHKHYSSRQVNIYVRRGCKPGFDLLMRRYPAVRSRQLKDPTTFLAHSVRMRAVRTALGRFIDDNGIVFTDPHTPVVSNNDTGLLTGAAEIRAAVLAATDEVMDSRRTAELVDGLDPDVVVEFGLGSKSVDLLLDNGVAPPVTAFTGNTVETDRLFRSMRLMEDLLNALERLRHAAGQPSEADHDILRKLLRGAVNDPVCEQYIHRSIGRVILAEDREPTAARSHAFQALLETVQHSYRHRRSIDIEKGELVLRARLKKWIVGPATRLGHVYEELRVITATGEVLDRSSADAWRAEAMVLHFGGPADMDYSVLASNIRLLRETNPLARLMYESVLGESLLAEQTGPMVERMAREYIAHQFCLLQLLQLYRPALFRQSDYYLEGSDPMGWLVALAAAGAVRLADVFHIYGRYLCSGGADAQSALEQRSSATTEFDRPIISPAGVPLQSMKDVVAATRTVLCDESLAGSTRSIHLNGACQILSLSADLAPGRVETGPYRAEVIPVLAPTDIWTKRVNPALDHFEERSMLALTGENERVLQHARGRRLLPSAVNSYVEIGERIVGFGKGGSESMTIFVARDGAA